MDFKPYEALALDVAKKHGKAAGKEMLLLVVLPMIKQMVAETPNKYDDMFYPMVEQSLLKLIEGL